jgi:hypothetical protein
MSETNVVNLPVASSEPPIWVCNCGCASFYLRGDGMAACVSCGVISDEDGQGWYQTIEDGPDRDPEQPSPIIDVCSNGNVDFARARIERFACQDDACTVLVVLECGAVHVWSVVETGEQQSWLNKKIDQAKELIGLHVSRD